MMMTVTIEDEGTTWTTSAHIICVSEALAVARDTMVSAGFHIGELAADNDCGDVIWSDEG